MDQMIENEAVDRGRIRAEQFADGVKSCNGEERGKQIVIWAVVYIALFSCCGLDYTQSVIQSYNVSVVFVSAVLSVITIKLFLNEYLEVNGIEGKLSGSLIPVIGSMPFDGEEYFLVVGKRFQRYVIGTGIAVFFVLLTGMFSPLLVVFSKEGIFNQGDEVRTIYQISVISFCAVSALLICGAMTGAYFMWKSQFLRQLEYRRSGSIVKKRERKTGYLTALSGVGTTCVGLWLYPLWNAIMGIIMEARLPLSAEVENYIRPAMWAGMAYFLIVFSASVIVEETAKADRTDKKRKKQIIYLGIMLLLLGVGEQTVYNGYRDECIEVSRIWNRQEYQWSEVESYTVKYSWWDGIQLVLQVDGKKLRVFGGNNLESEGHSAVYSSNQEYAAVLVERLDKLGIKGSCEDMEKLKEHIEDYDEEEVRKKARQALERIEAITAGNN